MKETIIAFVTFFMTIALLIQIKYIRKISELRKENERIIPDRLNVQSVWDIIEIVLMIIGGIISAIFLVWICKDAIEKEKIERKKVLEESYEEKIPSEKRKRKYEAYMKKIKQEKSRIKELTKGKEETNIWWISFTAKVSKQKVIEIFEEDPDFIVENGIIYNKELISKEELNNIIKKRAREEKIARRICPVCETPFETEELTETSCEKCGERLKVEVKPLIEIPEKSDQLAEIEEQSITEKRVILQYKPTWLLIFNMVNIILFFMPWRLAYYQIVIAIMIVGFGIRDVVIGNKSAIAITSIILAVMTIIFCILDFAHVFSIYESLN